MTNVENIILEQLRAIRADLADLKADTKTRLLNIEQGIANLHQDSANLRSIVAEQSVRLDRIERRLELAV